MQRKGERQWDGAYVVSIGSIIATPASRVSNTAALFIQAVLVDAKMLAQQHALIRARQRTSMPPNHVSLLPMYTISALGRSIYSTFVFVSISLARRIRNSSGWMRMHGRSHVN